MTQSLASEWGESPVFAPGARVQWSEETLPEIVAAFEEATQLERNSSEEQGV
jgi:hypothetical protein